MEKVVYDEILTAEGEKKTLWNVSEVAEIGDKKLWWDKKFVLPNKVKHNKPDLVIWNRQRKECKIIEFSVPLDQNVSMKETEKVNNYMPLVSKLQQLYHGYKYKIISAVAGALGAEPESLKRHLENTEQGENMNNTIRRMQLAALTGTVKTVKTVL